MSDRRLYSMVVSVVFLAAYWPARAATDATTCDLFTVLPAPLYDAIQVGPVWYYLVGDKERLTLMRSTPGSPRVETVDLDGAIQEVDVIGSSGLLIVTNKAIYRGDATQAGLWRFSFETEPFAGVMSGIERGRKPVTLLGQTQVYLFGKRGMYYLDLSPSPIPSAIIPEPIVDVVVVSSDTSGKVTEFVVNTERGSYLVEGSRSHGPYATGQVHHVTSAGDYKLLISSNGIFVVGPNYSEPRRLTGKLDTRFASVQEASGYLWFGVQDRLFRWPKGSSSEAQGTGLPAGPVAAVTGGTLLAAESQLYFLRESKGALRAKKIEGGSKLNGATFLDGPAGTWIFDDRGLYLWSSTDSGRLRLQAALTGYWLFGGDNIALRTSQGVYLAAAGLDPVFFPTEKVLDVEFAAGSAWLLLDSGIVSWRASSPHQLKRVDVQLSGTPGELGVYEESGVTYAQVGEQVFRVESDGTKAQLISKDSQAANAPDIRQKTAEFLAAAEELTRDDPSRWVVSPVADAFIRGEERRQLGPWHLNIQFPNHLPANIEVGQELTVTWKIDDFACRADSKTIYQTVFVESLGSERVVTTIEKEDIQPLDSDNTYRAVLPGLLERGDYRLSVVAVDVFGFQKSEKHAFSVGKTTLDLITTWAKISAVVIALASVLSFALLTFGARWSTRCFDILMDPVFRRAGIYFGPAIRYVRPIRLWVFEGYYQRMRKSLKRDHSYLPVTLRTESGESVESNALVGEIANHRVVWIVGAPGTGKSELMMELMREYFSHESLRAAWRKYKFVPLLVRVRDFGRLPVSGGEWVSEAARLSLKAQQVNFDDAVFFRGLVSCGDFVLLFDGMNEASRSTDFREYLAQAGAVRLLATSQGPPPSSDIRKLILPPFSVKEAGELLLIFLGRKHEVSIEMIGLLLGDLSSGYDVWLLANLIQQDTRVARTRLDLYAETLRLAATAGGSTFSELPVCRMAWHLWKSGVRAFAADTQVTEEMLIALRSAQIVVARGNSYEFRHDLMRGYLAARWLVQHSTSVEQILARLSAAEIWDLSPAEQDSVFPFVASLCAIIRTLQPLLNDALRQPAQRVRLIDAIQKVAERSNLTVTATID